MSLSALSSEVGNPPAVRTYLQLLRQLLSLPLHPGRFLTPFFTNLHPFRLQQYIPYPDAYFLFPFGQVPSSPDNQYPPYFTPYA